MVTKLTRKPEFDIPYQDTYIFDFDTLGEYVKLLEYLFEWTGIVVIQSTIKPLLYSGMFVVDNRAVPSDFYEQILQNYGK